MRHEEFANPKRSYMRFLFTGNVVACPLPDSATFQDVAVKLSDLLQRDHGELVSVAVVLNPSRTNRPARTRRN